MPKSNAARSIATTALTGLEHHEKACKEAYASLENTIGNMKASVSQATVTMQQTTEKLGEVDKKLEVIRKALLGDDFEEKPGLIQRVKALEKAIHGDDDNPGMFLRRDQVLRYAIVVAVLSTMVGGGAGAGAVNLIKLFFGG